MNQYQFWTRNSSWHISAVLNAESYKDAWARLIRDDKIWVYAYRCHLLLRPELLPENRIKFTVLDAPSDPSRAINSDPTLTQKEM